MEICRKWREKAFELTEKLAEEKKRLSEASLANNSYINELNSQNKNLKSKIKALGEEIENAKLHEKALDSAISQHSKSLFEISSTLDSMNQQIIPFIETKNKHLECISQLQSSEDVINEINELIDDTKITQMQHLVDLITSVKKKEQEYERKKTAAGKRSEYIEALKEIQRAQNEMYRLKLQWKAIEAELKEDSEEKEKLEELKTQYSALLQKGKAEISQTQSEKTQVYDEMKEKRDQTLKRQRELEKEVNEAQSNFVKMQEEKQEQIDELSKHVSDQKEEIEQLKEQIEKAKAEIDNYVDEGVTCDPPPSPIFDGFQIDSSILDLTKAPQPQQKPQLQQTQSNKIIADDNPFNDLLDRINELMSTAQNLTLD